MVDFAPSLLRRRYALILADPAWQTVLWSGDGRTPTQKPGADHYPTMSAEAMGILPIAEIAAPNAVLAMWVIGTHLDQALALGRDWGFDYVTDLFYWLKQRRIRPNQVDLFTGDVAAAPIGMGYYTRKQVEPCLLFKRGKGIPICDHAVEQLIVAPKREHSRKPDEQYPRLDRLFGDVPRIELFARTRRSGWDAWGNQTDKFPELRDA